MKINSTFFKSVNDRNLLLIKKKKNESIPFYIHQVVQKLTISHTWKVRHWNNLVYGNECNTRKIRSFSGIFSMD